MTNTLIKDITLQQGDCLELMKGLEDNSIDLICCDLPYQTTACKWDVIIPFDKLWEQYKRIIKTNGAIVLTASQPFTSALIMSGIEMFKYEWIWQKGRGSGFLHSKNKPLKYHENVCVFSKGTTVHASQSKNRMIYNPQMEEGTPYSRVQKATNIGKLNHAASKSNTSFVGSETVNEGTRFPKSIQEFKNHNVGNFHPTQKPVALMEYMIKTYTNEGMTVLDNCMGSGTTGVACIGTNRKFIGMEKDENYFSIAKERIEAALAARDEIVKIDYEKEAQ